MVSDLIQLQSPVYLSGKQMESVICVSRGVLEGDVIEVAGHKLPCNSNGNFQTTLYF